MRVSTPPRDAYTTTLSWVESLPPGNVTVVDTQTRRTRRIDDLILATAGIVGIAFLLVIALYMSSTVTGVATDVHDVLARIASGLIAGPIRIIENLVTLLAFIGIYGTLFQHSRWMRTVETTILGLISLGLAWLFTFLINHFASTDLVEAMQVTYNGQTYIGISFVIATLAGMATVAGQRQDDRILRWVWTSIWLLALLGMLQHRATVPGELIAILIGISAGDLWRFFAGVNFTRAEGAVLVAGISHCGIVPRTIERVDMNSASATITCVYTARLVDADINKNSLPMAQSIEFKVCSKQATTQPQNAGRPPQVVMQRSHRSYLVTDTSGKRYLAHIADPDRQMFTLIRVIWRNLRLRGIHIPAEPNVQAQTEKQALNAIAALHAGVNTPTVHGVSHCGDSMVTVTDLINQARPITAVSANEIADETIASLWKDLRAAHRTGIAHHNLDSDNVLIDGDGAAWIVDWSRAEVASSELGKRIDLMQLLVLTAAVCGCERAFAQARLQLGDEIMVTLYPLLQQIALPSQLADLDHSHKFTDKLRKLIEPLVPKPADGSLPRYELRRVTPTQLVGLIVGLAAAVVIFTAIDFNDMKQVISQANPWWILVAVACSFLTYVGAALNLMALTEEKLGLTRTVLVQFAASVIGLITPAGLGPAAVNLRFLTKRKVATPIAVATVGLVQVTQFLFTVLLLILVVLFTGKTLNVNMPSSELLFIIGLVAVLIAIVLAIPKVRKLIWNRLQPLLNQVWPRIIWIVNKPHRVALSAAGVAIQTAAYIAAFGASLAAFGHSLGIATLAVTFLTANTVGSMVPSPGGLGPVEAALTGALQLAGIPLASALSAVLLYRLATFWLPIPVGWFSFKILERKQEI